MEGLRLDKLLDEDAVGLPVFLGSLLLPLQVTLEVKKVVRALQIIHELGIVGLFFHRLLLFTRTVVSDVVVHSHQQKVEKQLFHAQLSVCPVLFIEVLVKVSL